MPNANLVDSVLFYDDVENANNPSRKHVEWKRSATGLTFDQVFSERFILPVGSTKTLESSVGAADLSATPVDLTAVTAQPTWYQIRGAFASPWAAALSVIGQPVIATVQVDESLILTGAGLAALTSVRPGDQVYLAGSEYGDTGPWSTSNQGLWSVQSVGTGLTLRRVDTNLAIGVTETVTVAAVMNVQHLADATRPRWCVIEGSAIFSGLHEVLGAASGWVAIALSSAYAPVSGVTFAELTVAPKYIKYLRVEGDVPVTVVVGGYGADVSNIHLHPLGTSTPGIYVGSSFATSLAIVNPGQSAAIINLIYAFSE